MFSATMWLVSLFGGAGDDLDNKDPRTEVNQNSFV
jgi:hypothetical protein